jgi:hypothetical protein
LLQKHRVKNRLQQRAIIKLAQTVALRVDQADRHHIGQIAVADLPRQPLALVVHPVKTLVVDRENRNEDNNEKIHN